MSRFSVLFDHPTDPGQTSSFEVNGHGPRHTIEVKPTNPKDAMGIKKVPMSCVSAPVLAEVGLGMLEGALKYGRHNYRVIGVRAGVYYDATMRHLMAWWEGEDNDPDSGLSHITKAIASLVVIRDAMLQDKFTDDRPPKSKAGWVERLNKQAEEMIAECPEPVAPYTEAQRAEIKGPNLRKRAEFDQVLGGERLVTIQGHDDLHTDYDAGGHGKGGL